MMKIKGLYELLESMKGVERLHQLLHISEILKQYETQYLFNLVFLAKETKEPITCLFVSNELTEVEHMACKLEKIFKNTWNSLENSERCNPHVNGMGYSFIMNNGQVKDWVNEHFQTLICEDDLCLMQITR